MSFFAVQVRTGSEIAVKQMINEVLHRSRDGIVKAIYAMESYTQIINERTDAINLTEATSNDITSHLYAQRLQTSLSNLRVACEGLKRHDDINSLKLIEEYRSHIKVITQKLRSIRDTSKKISSVLPGYILIELENNFHYLPDHLWYLITKGVPKVIGIPNRMNIPKEEVDFFFQQVDLSPELEIQLDEALSYEETAKAQDELLHKANQSSVSEREEILDDIDTMKIDINKEIEQLKQISNSLIEKVKGFIRNNRKTVSMPATIFCAIYIEIKSKHTLPTLSATDLLTRLRRWLSTKGEVMLE